MGNKTEKDVVVLLSGGLDSTTVTAIAKSQGYRLNAISFNYGQRHQIELECARRVAESFEVYRHIVVDIDMRVFDGSALVDDIEIPKGRPPETQSKEIPSTYVPARNTIFLSYALAWAEVLGCEDIFIGVNAVDYSGYPDCRPEYIDAYQNMANLATKICVEGKGHIRIHTPLMNLSKSEIIERGMELGVDYSMTNSCYAPSEDGAACGECDACTLRLKGFAEAGSKDPSNYQT